MGKNYRKYSKAAKIQKDYMKRNIDSELLLRGKYCLKIRVNSREYNMYQLE